MNLLKYVLFPLCVWLVGRKTLYQYFDFFRCGLLVHFIFRLHKILIHVHDYEVMGFLFFNFASHIFPFYAHYNSSINPTTNNPCLLLHVFLILYLSTYTHNTTHISIIIHIYKLNLSPCLPYKKSYLEFLKNSILK